MDSAPDHYTTVEAARLLGLAVRSVQLMVDRGELEAWKTSGGHRRIAKASVDRWLSQRGAGSPRRAAPAAEAPVAPAGASAPPRVLLIDDSVHYQTLVSLLVKRRFPGVDLRVASDGIAGLALVGEWRPDVLIVDILLPGIDGATLITSLRSSPQFAHVALLVLTSLDEAQREPYAFALDGLGVVHKPRLVEDLPRLLAPLLPAEAATAPALAPAVAAGDGGA